MYNNRYLVNFNRNIFLNLTAGRHFSIYNNELQSKLKSGKLTYYDVLQVPRTATKEEIKNAYLKLVKEFHPDLNKNHDKSIFICIKESHDVLSDRNKRVLYNQKLMQVKKNMATRSTLHAERKDLEERFERYKRYTSGVRTENDDPEAWVKTVPSVLLGCVTIALVCLVSGDLITRFPLSSSVDDSYEEDDVQGEELVLAFFNPFTHNWERVIKPYQSPRPEHLIRHYATPSNEGAIDNLKIVPRNKLAMIEMPISLTTRPTVLYDPIKDKPIVIS